MDQLLPPMDACGCGDIGYLKTKTIPVDLTFGVGQVLAVPVYRCRSAECASYTLPDTVLRRLEEIAEEMQETEVLERTFAWEDIPDALQQNAILQAFTFSFMGQEYEDIVPIDLIPAEAVFFQSLRDPTEYYILKYEEERTKAEPAFSFCKFYYDEAFSIEGYLTWEADDGYLKELTVLQLSEVHDLLNEEFGAL
ncbi:MAG: hypothetical protein LBT32_09660 [Peptococcaceae bacterium]|nr:hypothetical protein [Peptococcaceae bacterium]